MATTKWNLNTTQQLTAEPGSAEGLTTWPPFPANQRIISPDTPFMPPKPLWYTAGDPPVAVPAGRVSHRVIQIFWRSNVGMIPEGSTMPPLPPTPGTDPNNKGSKGIESAGIGGHNIYINVNGQAAPTEPSLKSYGPEVNAWIEGYYTPAVPVTPPQVSAGPVWNKLLPGTKYDIVVEAFDVNGQAAVPAVKSDVLTVTTNVAPTSGNTTPFIPPADAKLSTPMVLSLGAGSTDVFLQWYPVPGATVYEIWDNNSVNNANDVDGMDPARPGLMLGDKLVLKWTPQPADLLKGYLNYKLAPFTTPGLPYSFKVRAIREVAQQPTIYGGFSIPVRGTVPDAVSVPGVPTVAAAVVTGARVNITITPAAVSGSAGPAAYYGIYIDGAFVARVNAPLGAAPQYTYQAKAPTTGTTTLKVAARATNSMGGSNLSTAVDAVIPVAAAPAAPQNLRLLGFPTATDVPVQWDAIPMDPPVTKYTVYEGGTTKKFETTTTSGEAAGYTAGATYNLTVKATNSVGEGAASTALTGKTSAVPAAPTGLNYANDTAPPGDGTMPIKWVAPAGASPQVIAYRIYDGTKVLMTVDAPAVTATLTGFKAVQAYRISVRAVNAVGEGAKSNELVGVYPSKPATPTTQPAVTQSDVPGAGKAKVTITPLPTQDPPVTKYTVYDGTTNKGDITASPWSLEITGTAGASYNMTYTATNTVGESGKSPVRPGQYPTAPLRAEKGSAK